MVNLLSINRFLSRLNGGLIGEVEVWMAVNFVFDRLKLGFGLKPDGEVTVERAPLFPPQLLSAAGNFFMGDRVFLGHLFGQGGE
jgi:hypothetical protein